MPLLLIVASVLRRLRPEYHFSFLTLHFSFAPGTGAAGRSFAPRRPAARVRSCRRFASRGPNDKTAPVDRKRVAACGVHACSATNCGPPPPRGCGPPTSNEVKIERTCFSNCVPNSSALSGQLLFNSSFEFAASRKPQRAAAPSREGPQLASRRSARACTPQAAPRP